jgi:hypothetical protein
LHEDGVTPANRNNINPAAGHLEGLDAPHSGLRNCRRRRCRRGAQEKTPSIHSGIILLRITAASAPARMVQGAATQDAARKLGMA